MKGDLQINFHRCCVKIDVAMVPSIKVVFISIIPN